MSENRRPSYPILETAQQELKDAQARIAELEAQLSEASAPSAVPLGTEEQLKLFVGYAPAAFAMLDRDMKYLVVSDRWLTDYRLGEQDIIGRSHYDVFPDIPEHWKEIHRRCLAGAEESSEAEPFPRADGSVDWVRWEIHPWRTDTGEIGGILILTEVITKRKLAEDHARRLNRTLAMLSDINQAIVRVRDLPTLFEQACNIVVEKGDFGMAWVGLLDPATQRVKPVAHAGVTDGVLEGNGLILSGEVQGRSASARALRAGQHIVCNDLAHDRRASRWRAEALRMGCRASAAFPLIVAGEVRGTLTLYADETDFFDADELRILDELAGDIAFAMEFAEQEAQRQQAEAAVEHYAQRVEMLHEIDIGIISARSIHDLAEAALKRIRRIIPCQRVSMRLLDDNRKEWLVFAVETASNTFVREGTRFPVQPGTLKHFNRTPVEVFDDLNQLGEPPPTISVLIDEGLVCALHVCFYVDAQVWGDIVLFADSPGFFSADDQEIAVEIATQLGIAVQRVRLSEALARHTARLEEGVAERTAELQSSKDSVEVILNNSADGILLVSSELRIRQSNAAFNSLFGCNPDDCFDQPLTALVHPDDTAHLISALQPDAAASLEKGIEVRARRKDGSVFEAELSIGRIVNNGLVCTIHDITERKARERQLRYHASLQENMSDAVIVTNMEFRVQSWNRAAERIYGWRAEEVIGKKVAAIIPTQNWSLKEIEGVARQLREQGWWQGEVAQQRKDGSFRHILGSVTLMKDDNGAPFGIIAVNHDVTEQRQAAEALRQSAAEIHDLYNNAPCGYHSLDKDGLIVQINDTELKWIGYTRDEVVNKLKITDIFTPESVRTFRQTFPSFVERGYVNDLEFDVIRKDGSHLHILLNGTAIYDDDGHYLKSRSTMFDITALQETRRALVESETRYRLLAEHISDVLVQLTPDGVLQFITPSCYALLGYTPEEMIGRSGFEFMHLGDRPKVQSALEQALNSSESTFSFTTRLRPKAGHHVWVEVGNNIIRDPNTGAALEIIAVIRDISERKAQEEQIRYHASLYEHVNDAVVSTDMDWNIQSWNPAAERIYGWCADEAMGKKTVELLRSRFESNLNPQEVTEEFFQQGYWRGEVVQYRKDGAELHILASLNLLYDEDNRAIGTVGVNVDISERKKLEQSLQVKLKEEQEFQAHLKGLHDITIELTPVDHMDTFYRRVVELGLERLGFERLSLFLYDEENNLAIGTYGTDVHGEITDERHVRFTPSPTGIMMRAYERSERFAVDEPVTLLTATHPTGTGWNAAAVLWNGAESLGWLVADNGVRQQPASKPLLDTLSLYALTVGTLLVRKKTNAALRESEARYRLLADTITDVVMRINSSMEYVYISPSSKAVLGYEPEELLGRQDFQRIHPDDVPSIQQLVKHMYEQPSAASLTYRFRHKDGHYIWVETTGRAVVSEQTGQVVEFVLSARDISARKKAEASLQAKMEEERKFQGFLMALHEITIDLTQANRVDTFYSRTIELGLERLGFERLALFLYDAEHNAVIGTYGTDVHGEISDEHDVHFTLAPTGVMMRAYERSERFAVDDPIPLLTAGIDHPTGTGWNAAAVLWNGKESLGWLVADNGIHHEPASEPLFEILSLYALTIGTLLARLRTNTALRKSQQMLQMVLDTIPVRVFWKDRNLVIQGANRLAAQDAGLDSSEAIVGKSDYDLAWRQEAQAYRADDQAVIASGISRLLYEEPQTGADGSRRWLQTSKIPLRNPSGEIIGVLGAYSDITERKRAEIALRESEERFRMLVEFGSDSDCDRRSGWQNHVGQPPGGNALRLRPFRIDRANGGNTGSRIFAHGSST